jgi:hypothetical protein
MRCPVCRTELQRVGTVLREYSGLDGRVYARRKCPRYAPCPRLGDPAAHPARNRARPAPPAERTAHDETTA